MDKKMKLLLFGAGLVVLFLIGQQYMSSIGAFSSKDTCERQLKTYTDSGSYECTSCSTEYYTDYGDMYSAWCFSTGSVGASCLNNGNECLDEHCDTCSGQVCDTEANKYYETDSEAYWRFYNYDGECGVEKYQISCKEGYVLPNGDTKLTTDSEPDDTCEKEGGGDTGGDGGTISCSEPPIGDGSLSNVELSSSNVSIEDDVTVEVKFKASADSCYVVEARMEEESTKQYYSIFESKESTCDGDPNFPGVQKKMDSGDTNKYELTFDSELTEKGNYSIIVGAYRGCHEELESNGLSQKVYDEKTVGLEVVEPKVSEDCFVKVDGVCCEAPPSSDSVVVSKDEDGCPVFKNKDENGEDEDGEESEKGFSEEIKDWINNNPYKSIVAGMISIVLIGMLWGWIEEKNK